MTKRRLFEVDYDREDGVVIHLRPQAMRLVPSETRRHWRNANKEMLLMFRSLLDKAIDRFDAGDDDTDRKQKGPRRVNVTEGGQQ